VPDDSVDLIFTDPPYVQSGVSLFGDLVPIAARVLRPGGDGVSRLLRQCFLPEVLTLLWRASNLRLDVCKFTQYGGTCYKIQLAKRMEADRRIL